MRVLTKYLIREFTKFFVIFEAVFLFLYLVIDFLDRIDNFIEAGVAGSIVFFFFLYKLPFTVVQMAPPALALTVIVTFSLLRRSHEITAMKSCGINLFDVSRILLFAALCIGAVTFLISDILVPYASTRGNRIWKTYVNKMDPSLFYGSNQIWYKGPDRIYWIRHFSSGSNTMNDATFYFFDGSFRLIRKIECRKGMWVDGNWILEDAIVQKLDGRGEYRLNKFDRLTLDLPENPDSFKKGMKEPEEMDLWHLKRYAEDVRKEGYDSSKYLVDMNIKIAFPFICLILVIMGIPIALELRSGSIPMGVSVGIGVCFLYFLTLGFSRSLGLMGAIPPILAAWLPNILFSFIGIYLMLRLRR